MFYIFLINECLYYNCEKEFCDMILPVCAFKKWIVLQSEPLLDNPYAKILPSSLKLLLVIATVPSSERVLGSRNTLGSLSRVSCTYKTLKKKNNTPLS